MTPSIPLTPQQRRQRRKNIFFFCSSMGVAIGFLLYVFYPDIKQLVTEESEGTPVSESASPAPQQAEQGSSSQAEAGHKPAPQPQNGSTEEQASLSAYSAEAEKALSVDPFLTATASRNESAPADNIPSEEELAKLPPWQAAFARLDKEKRYAFAAAFSRAKEAFHTEQWASCLALLNDCELIYDGSPDVWNLRACALLSDNSLDEAETFINRSLELNPNDAVALMSRSELLMRRRDFRSCITILEKLRKLHHPSQSASLHNTFTYHQLLCHLMLRQEMEARALVSGLTPLSDTPLYYYSQAAFSIYMGNSNGALEPLRSATTIYGNSGETSSYRKWLNKCGLAEKYGNAKHN